MNPLNEQIQESDILTAEQIHFLDTTFFNLLHWKKNDFHTRQFVTMMLNGYMGIVTNNCESQEGTGKYEGKTFKFFSVTCDDTNNDKEIERQNSMIIDFIFKSFEDDSFIVTRMKLVKGFNGHWMWDFSDDHFKWVEENV